MSNFSDQKYDYAVIIGRFNPAHLGHQELIEESFKIAKNTIILIGSCFKPRDIKNPFTGHERADMISSMFPKVFGTSRNNHIYYDFLQDYVYNDQKWVMQVQSKVDKIIEFKGKDPDKVSICILGGKKDDSSYYLDMFPQWDLVEYKFVNDPILSATDIREKLFTCQTNEHDRYIKPFLNPSVYNYIEERFKTDWFKNLILEFDHIKRYKEAWSKAPYAPTFITTDNVVICSGHILMIERRSAPGRGTKALPGGFLDQNERILDGAIRELREETKLKVPEPVLRGSIKKQQIFDHPTRSMRGRTVTVAFLIDLGNGELPRVKGGDDAKSAFWVPLNDVKPEHCFEDHYDIISEMVGI